MFSVNPIQSDKLPKDVSDKALLRLAIASELDAITLYEQMAATVKDADLRTILLKVAKEEKTHVGEFHTLLTEMDSDQAEELEAGREEVEEALNRLFGEAESEDGADDIMIKK